MYYDDSLYYYSSQVNYAIILIWAVVFLIALVLCAILRGLFLTYLAEDFSEKPHDIRFVPIAQEYYFAHLLSKLKSKTFVTTYYVLYSIMVAAALLTPIYTGLILLSIVSLLCVYVLNIFAYQGIAQAYELRHHKLFGFCFATFAATFQIGFIVVQSLMKQPLRQEVLAEIKTSEEGVKPLEVATETVSETTTEADKVEENTTASSF